ncbi:hypothetical protein [Baaleninema sp.]|uniref:hypothetical protein n=1 Tax=Baaleninema sp. TaxID=3101197 RepID=UPI003CFC3ED6
MLKVNVKSKELLAVVAFNAALLLSGCNLSSPPAEPRQPDGDIATEATPSPESAEIPVAEEVPLDATEEPEAAPEAESQPENGESENGESENGEIGEASAETAPAATPTSEVAPIFEGVLAEIQPVTEIPVLLPNEVPLPEDSTIYAVADAEVDRYEIELAFNPDCRGASACFYGMFAAKRTDGDYYGVGETFAETVELANGVTGYFNPMMCGASCAPPVMEWSIEGVRYRISLKGLGGDDAVAREKMTELANSAILSREMRG